MSVRWPRPARAFPWTTCLLALGLGLRCAHYLRNPSMWHDEAALAINVLRQGYPDLLGPLIFSEAAPPLFLWTEKALVGLLGDSTFSLRLFPLLASCASLVGLVVIARRLLPAEAVPWVALLAGCSDSLLWHTCEAKPYTVDALVATGLLGLLVFGRDWPLQRHLLLAIVLTPTLVFLSYPGCFLLGGLALSHLPAVVGQRRAGPWLLFALFLIVLGGSFGLLLLGPIHAQKNDALLHCWTHTFPRWERPWTVPGWLGQHLTEVVRYAYEPTGNILFGVACVGAALLWRGGRRRVVTFLVAPVALAGLAGLARQYPFGAFRVMVYAAPASLLLMGAGLPCTWRWFRRFGRLGPIGLVGLVFFPVGQAGYRLVHPWTRADAAGAHAFVRRHIQPYEMVLGNSWEDLYYFRDGQIPYQTIGTGRPPRCGRLWLVATAATAELRQELLQIAQPCGPWQVLDAKEFPRITVYHLERVSPPRRVEPGGSP